MRYEIVDIVFPHPSFSWANGRYIIVDENYRDGCIELCRFENGEPEMYNDEYSTSVTGKNNFGVTRTGKFYIDKRFRKEKLERILNEDDENGSKS